MSWRTVRLGEIVEIFSVRAKDIDDCSNLRFCGVSNQDGITISKYAAEDKAEDYKIIEKGCFAYNPYRVNVGSIALFSEERKGLISPAYVVFKTKPHTIIDELLLRFLKSKEGLRQIRLHGRGTVRQALRFEDLCKIELSIPSYETQLELFEKLDIQQKAGSRISTELGHQLDLVKELRQAYLREAMQGKLVPQDPTDEPADILLEKIKAEKEILVAEKRIKRDKPLPPTKPEELPFEIPSKWIWCKLGEVAQVKIGSTPSRQNLSLWNGNINWVSSGEVANNYIYSTREKIAASAIENTSLSVYPKGSVLVAMIGQGKTRGQTAILKIDATTNQNVAGLIINNDFLSSEFLWFFFRSRYELTRSGASGGNQPALNGIKISNTLFPLPPLAEQERIVAKLEKLMKFCDELEANIKQGITNANRLLQTALREALEPNG